MAHARTTRVLTAGAAAFRLALAANGETHAARGGRSADVITAKSHRSRKATVSALKAATAATA